LAPDEDSEAPVPTSGIGDQPGTRLRDPPVCFAKLDERVLIEMLVHGQMVQMVRSVIDIAGLRMDPVHLVVKRAQ